MRGFLLRAACALALFGVYLLVGRFLWDGEYGKAALSFLAIDQLFRWVDDR